jgi:phosphoglycolate phosphatase
MNNILHALEKIRLIVFDWDGTLADSEAIIVSAMQKTIQELNMPVTNDYKIKNVIGLGLDEAIHCLYSKMSARNRRQFADEYRQHYLIMSAGGITPLFPHAREMLELLLDYGYLLAVATGKSRRGLDRSLKETNTDQFFHTSRCADECFSKPHPQMLQEIMETLYVKPEDTIMIGDSEYDLQMAESAGTTSIAVSYGVHDENRLLQYKPLACLDNLYDLKNWLVYQ